MLSGWSLERRQERQLMALLILLEGVDHEMANGSLIFKKGATGLYYLKINGNQALRPRCCLGPELSEEEYGTLRLAREPAGEAAVPKEAMRLAGKANVLTFLERVSKKDGREIPLLKDSKAMERMGEIQSDRSRRQPVAMHRRGDER